MWKYSVRCWFCHEHISRQHSPGAAGVALQGPFPRNYTLHQTTVLSFKLCVSLLYFHLSCVFHYREYPKVSEEPDIFWVWESSKMFP